LWYRDVTLGRRGAVALLTLLIAQCVSSALVSAQTIFVPSLTLSERYDTNIFWAPKSLLAPGSKPEDFVTMVVPQLNINHTGSLIRGSVFGTGLITKYINNPDRDFIGYNAGGQLNLVDAARQVSQRITALTVRGTYRNIPATTGFGASGGGLGLGFGSISGAALQAGQVTNRASRQIYTLGVGGGYQLTGVTSLMADYLYTSISFGEQSGGVNNPLFDTTIHRASTTPARPPAFFHPPPKGHTALTPFARVSDHTQACKRAGRPVAMNTAAGSRMRIANETQKVGNGRPVANRR